MKIKMFTYDRSGYKVFHHSGEIGEAERDVWPFAFAEQIEDILKSANVGEIHPLNVWWSAEVVSG